MARAESPLVVLTTLDALRALDENRPPAVMVLDLMLPRVGGLGVYRAMCARDVTREVL